jgi:hypothetical protein
MNYASSAKKTQNQQGNLPHQQPALTVGFTRGAAFAMGRSFQGSAHNQNEPRYNRREAASGASGVGWQP